MTLAKIDKQIAAVENVRTILRRRKDEKALAYWTGFNAALRSVRNALENE